MDKLRSPFGVTNRIITQLHKRGGEERGVLAALRSSNSILSKKATIIWPILFENMDENSLGTTKKLTRQEKAIFTALKCYAIFEQGNDFIRDENYDNSNSISIFKALSLLRNDDQKREGVDRRVKNLLSTTNIESTTNSLVSLIKILKGSHPNLALNYPQLALDLDYYQSSFEASRRISIKWGREYFITTIKNDANEEKEND